MRLRSFFGYFVAAALAVLAIVVKIQVFVLRAMGSKGPTEVIDLARKQSRTSRILMIRQVLREDLWAAGMTLGAEDASVLREELEIPIGEERADLRRPE